MTVLDEIELEMQRQDATWGITDHADAPSSLPTAAYLALGVPPAATARSVLEAAFASGNGTWAHILIEELSEAIDEAAVGNTARLRAELVQVAAVAAQWAAAIDRRGVRK